MSWPYRTFVRPFLFLQDSEKIHNRTLKALAAISQRPALCNLLHSVYGGPALQVNLFGLRFPNPVGLAAGMDKHAMALTAWETLGFGFSELGGVTWHSQPGNPAPRMFRAVPDRALINRMGFNNDGAQMIAQRLGEWKNRNRWPSHPVGVNLGKSKVTSLAEAALDYVQSLTALWTYADFFVVNVSSPNTPGLRALQDRAALDEILAALQEANARLAQSAGREPKPILVKVAPDLTFEALDEIIELAAPRSLAGIVATNTTIARPSSAIPALQRIYSENGGLSGHPLAQRSTEIIRHIHRATNGKLPIIGVGGIFDAADAWDKILAGASLIQVYTGLVYEGPGLVKTILQGIKTRLQAEGASEIAQVVGTNCR